MIKEFKFSEPMLKSVYSDESEEIKNELSLLQLKLKEQNLPVVVIFEGMSAAGKGRTISETILSLDPRFFKTYSMAPVNKVEKRFPRMQRYWNKIPKKGQISFFDRSWYKDLFYDVDNIDFLFSQEFQNRIKNIETFERQLSDNGYLIIKFYIHITKEEQKKRLKKLSSKKETAWRVNKFDWGANKYYNQMLKFMDGIVEQTNFDFSNWHIIDGVDKLNRNIQVLRTIKDTISKALEEKRKEKPDNDENAEIAMPGFRLIKKPLLEEVNLNRSIDPIVYKEMLNKYQKRLKKIQNEMYIKKIPAIIVFEGWDAGGKGGAIKRVAGSFDARSYAVNPVSSPSPEEASYHYLWRFWDTVPKNGHIAIYDRSWYGRVLVERVENFATNSQWQRAYREINEFEKELNDWGAAVIKFWMQIDTDTQLTRFNERQKSQFKQWKITDEDWRNRKKTPQYEVAANQMIKLTSTDFSPWNIIEANDKLYARIKVLQVLEKSLSNHLKLYKKRNK